jgi:hypothetical protein
MADKFFHAITGICKLNLPQYSFVAVTSSVLLCLGIFEDDKVVGISST